MADVMLHFNEETFKSKADRAKARKEYRPLALGRSFAKLLTNRTPSLSEQQEFGLAVHRSLPNAPRVRPRRAVQNRPPVGSSKPASGRRPARTEFRKGSSWLGRALNLAPPSGEA